MIYFLPIRTKRVILFLIKLLSITQLQVETIIYAINNYSRTSNRYERLASRTSFYNALRLEPSIIFKYSTSTIGLLSFRSNSFAFAPFRGRFLPIKQKHSSSRDSSACFALDCHNYTCICSLFDDCKKTSRALVEEYSVLKWDIRR